VEAVSAGFENRILNMKIPAVECRARLAPHLQDELDGFRHLVDARRWSRTVARAKKWRNEPMFPATVSDRRRGQGKSDA
jgi:hypothetical protein